MQMLKKILVAGAIIALAGCGSLEKRQADAVKSKLPHAREFVLSKLASAKVSSGFGPMDLKFELTPYGDKFVTCDHTGALVVLSREGKVLHKHKLNIALSSGPVVYQDKALVGGRDGSVIMYDLRTKLIEWQAFTSGEVLAPPTADGQMVFVHSLDGSISALNFKNGRLQWRYASKLPTMILRRSSAPLITDKSLIAGFANGTAIALDKFDGSVLWNTTVAQGKGETEISKMVDLSVKPKLVGSKVIFASYRGGITAVRKNTGQIIWQNSTPSFTELLFEGDFAFVALTSGEIAKISLTNGKIMWKNDKLVGRRFAKPAKVGKKIVLADEDGFIHLLDKTNGKYLSRARLAKDGVETTLVQSDGKLFALSKSGTFITISTNSF